MNTEQNYKQNSTALYIGSQTWIPRRRRWRASTYAEGCCLQLPQFLIQYWISKGWDLRVTGHADTMDMETERTNTLSGGNSL